MKEIPLTKGYVALVDDEDYERLSKYSWYAVVQPSGCVYAATKLRGSDGKQHMVYMHVMIMGFPPKGVEVDHINGDGRNDQKVNLRLSDSRRNKQSFMRKPKNATSKFRGVYWHKAANKWHAKVKQAGKDFYIGLFESEEDAARARDKKALELFGSIAQLNFPL